ncbi:Sensitivity To Red Light Reduced-like [Macleaya cordata]|uniref:Sensitivity To Red Light Reduced-like n=1 Tax=Macleaya cordata TaxID=56857 RepID=A0A200PSG7_MACCD|nr:Sensitivity To Red Light Reduced-like [Macleaya cordata]
MAEDSPHTITATVKNLNSENFKPNGDWTVVVPRRGKQKRRNHPKIETIEQAAWTPSDFETDLERESKLMQKIQICITKLENSDFYRTFLNQIQTPQILNYFTSILASEPKMQMVIYGIGSIDSYEPPRLQLALAILIKRSFDWIGDIEVFDPVLSKTESQVLEALGCSVLLVNEQGRRQVLKPTMFFMPHCEAVLYDNLLQANWQAEFLNRMVVFGNSFKRYAEFISEFKNCLSFDRSVNHVLAIRRFSIEVGIETVSDDFFRPFHDSSWHFFNLDPEMELELKSINY